MKQFLPFILIASLFAACIDESANNKASVSEAEQAIADSANFTTVKWIDSVKNMGTISEGQKLEVSFRFQNTGSKPLVIQTVTPSCGCTVPEKPEKPVMPGQEGIIKAVFNSEGRAGTNHKTLNVVANTQGGTNHMLEFNIEVVGKTEGPKATTPQPTPGL